jgi:flagellar hook-associated protein 1 FlgK
MADLLSALDIATRGLLVTQRGVAVTGHNIANVNTPGYSRQRQVLEAEHPVSAADGSIGMGVLQATIQRITDAFVDRQLVAETSSFASLDAQARALSHLDALLGEQQNEGVAAALSRLYRAFSDLASATEPGAPTERAAVLSTANSLVATIARVDAQLRDLQRGQDRAIADLVPQINDLVARIASLNQDINRAVGTAPPNDLLDQRDQLVRELAGKIDVSTFERSDGQLVVLVAGGIPLVDGARTSLLEARPDASNPFDPTFSRIFFVGSGSDFDITADVGGGELGGLLRARDTISADAIRGLDTLAYNLANTVNEQHRRGFGLTDALPRDFFAQPASIEDAARNLALAADLAAPGGDNRIAAGGSAGPSGALPGDNENALLLAALEHSAAPTYQRGDPLPPSASSAPSGPVASVIDLASSMLAGLGQQARSAEQARDQQARVVETLETRRDEISGVSLDEEVTDLVRLQATFQANARVITTVSQLLEELVAML